jgi:hypothetical protein
VDFEAAEWQIPAENSKTRALHIVYLSRQSAEIFRERRNLAGRFTLGYPESKQHGQALQHHGIEPSSGGCELRDSPFTIHHS